MRITFLVFRDKKKVVCVLLSKLLATYRQLFQKISFKNLTKTKLIRLRKSSNSKVIVKHESVSIDDGIHFFIWKYNQQIRKVLSSAKESSQDSMVPVLNVRERGVSTRVDSFGSDGA